jgi:hypothetical protein
MVCHPWGGSNVWAKDLPDREALEDEVERSSEIVILRFRE